MTLAVHNDVGLTLTPSLIKFLFKIEREGFKNAFSFDIFGLKQT